MLERASVSLSSASTSPVHSPSSPPPPAENGASGDENVETRDFEFIEKPLGLTAEQGYGYIQVEFGEQIGPGNRYTMIRKLGWGMNSSVWLAKDKIDDRYVSIKALTGYSSRILTAGYMQELEILQRISTDPPTSNHCLSLLAHFTHPGKDQDGEHLCFVTDLLGGHVNTLRKMSSTRALPLPLARRVLLHTLRGLAHTHKYGVAHTDLKGDNIMMDLGNISTQDLDALLHNDPPRRHPPEPSWFKQVQVAALAYAVPRRGTLALFSHYFGSAQFCDRQVVDTVTPDTLRAPETILKGPWNEKVDIWIFGCLIFEFLTGKSLFTHESPALKPYESHLFQMMCVTGERFMPPQLQESRASLEYFDSKTCLLKACPRLVRFTCQSILSSYKILSQADMDGAAELIAKCLRLDPKNRPSAEELLIPVADWNVDCIIC